MLEACCNTRLADSPRGDGGQSAKHRPDIYLDGCGTHSSFLSSSSLCPEPSGAERSRRRRPFPSISLLRPPNLDSSRGNLPRHPLHLSKPLDRLLTAGILPHHRRTPLELLEALLHHRSASPVVLRSNRPREWIRGEFLVLSGLFPLPWCVAGAGDRPPPSPPHLLPPAARGKS